MTATDPPGPLGDGRGGPIGLGAHRFRGDIQGLRAVAVLVVLLFHAGLPLLPGGFVGVDVFFVISGFLITGLLLKEIARTGRVSFREFYARRARRILPAALAVVVLTLVGGALVYPPSEWARLGATAAMSALSVVNWGVAQESTDYFAQDEAASPLQHYWSLAVEEQFYLLWRSSRSWPSSASRGCGAARRRGPSRRAGAPPRPACRSSPAGSSRSRSCSSWPPSCIR